MAKKKPALGRGLDALIRDSSKDVPVSPDPAVEETPIYGDENTILFVDINEIRPNKAQPRVRFEEEAIEGLASSISEHGILQPVILQRKGSRFELVSGERRLRAAKKAGLKTIPAIVRELSAEENAIFAVIENMQREDLNPIEEANAFKNLMDSYHMTQEQIAKSVGKSRPYVANTLRILKLPEVIREYIEENKLTAGHANALGMVTDEKKQTAIAKKIIDEGLSVREAENIANIANSSLAPDKKRRKKNRDPEFAEIEDQLTSIFGTRVTIEGTRKTGNVKIKYYSEEELEGLIEELRKRR